MYQGGLLMIVKFKVKNVTTENIHMNSFLKRMLSTSAAFLMLAGAADASLLDDANFNAFKANAKAINDSLGALNAARGAAVAGLLAKADGAGNIDDAIIVFQGKIKAVEDAVAEHTKLSALKANLKDAKNQAAQNLLVAQQNVGDFKASATAQKFNLNGTGDAYEAKPKGDVVALKGVFDLAEAAYKEAVKKNSIFDAVNEVAINNAKSKPGKKVDCAELDPVDQVTVANVRAFIKDGANAKLDALALDGLYQAAAKAEKDLQVAQVVDDPAELNATNEKLVALILAETNAQRLSDEAADAYAENKRLIGVEAAKDNFANAEDFVKEAKGDIAALQKAMLQAVDYKAVKELKEDAELLEDAQEEAKFAQRVTKVSKGSVDIITAAKPGDLTKDKNALLATDYSFLLGSYLFTQSADVGLKNHLQKNFIAFTTAMAKELGVRLETPVMDNLGIDPTIALNDEIADLKRQLAEARKVAAPKPDVKPAPKPVGEKSAEELELEAAQARAAALERQKLIDDAEKRRKALQAGQTKAKLADLENLIKHRGLINIAKADKIITISVKSEAALEVVRNQVSTYNNVKVVLVK